MLLDYFSQFGIYLFCAWYCCEKKGHLKKMCSQCLISLRVMKDAGSTLLHKVSTVICL